MFGYCSNSPNSNNFVPNLKIQVYKSKFLVKCMILPTWYLDCAFTLTLTCKTCSA